jgi:phosphatidylglycerophosphatase A
MSTADSGPPGPTPALAGNGWLVLIATAGGLGRLRPAPGTWGTLGAGLLAWPWLLAGHLGAVPASAIVPGLIIATLVATCAGWLSCPAACARFRCADPSAVVIDEVAGTWLALAVMPVGLLVTLPGWSLFWAMALFRVFDIAKPPPVAWLERLPGAAGIMSDDLAAGVLAGMLATAVLH